MKIIISILSVVFTLNAQAQTAIPSYGPFNATVLQNPDVELFEPINFNVIYKANASDLQHVIDELAGPGHYVPLNTNTLLPDAPNIVTSSNPRRFVNYGVLPLPTLPTGPQGIVSLAAFAADISSGCDPYLFQCPLTLLEIANYTNESAALVANDFWGTESHKAAKISTLEYLDEDNELVFILNAKSEVDDFRYFLRMKVKNSFDTYVEFDPAFNSFFVVETTVIADGLLGTNPRYYSGARDITTNVGPSNTLSTTIFKLPEGNIRTQGIEASSVRNHIHINLKRIP